MRRHGTDPFFVAPARSRVRGGQETEPPVSLRPQTGVTLVELLVVLVIALGVAVVAAPLFSGAVARAELRETATELAGLLRYVRSEAIARREETALVCALDETRERRCRVPGLGKSYAIPAELDVKLVTADFGRSDRSAEVRFFPDGTSSGGDITLSRDGRGYAIRVEWLSGQVSLREHDDD